MSLEHWALALSLFGLVMAAPHLNRAAALKWSGRLCYMAFLLAIANLIKLFAETLGGAS